MWKPIVPCLAIANVLLGGAGVLQAQLVQVEPGYVRAPFVRVYTGPGGTYVRAPFVAVQGGGLRQVGTPPGPEELAQLDARALRQVIRELSLYLDEQLSSLSTGDTWKAYLKTAEIRALVGTDRDATPTADSVKMSRQILKAFDATRNNPEYRRVFSLDGFQGLYDALVEFSADPEMRARRQLAAASESLNRSLDQFSESGGWRKHLALPAEVQTDEGTPPNRDELARLLARYDAVSRNPEYRAVANLPAFQAVHERLANYMNQSAGSLPPAPAAEELPVPKGSTR